MGRPFFKNISKDLRCEIHLVASDHSAVYAVIERVLLMLLQLLFFG